MKVSGTLQSRKDDERERGGEVYCYLVKEIDLSSEQSLIYLLNRFHFLSHNYHQSMERERERERGKRKRDKIALFKLHTCIQSL